MYPFRELFMALIRMELSGVVPEEAMVREITPELVKKLYLAARTHDMGHMIGASLQKLGLLEESDPMFLEFRKKQFVAAARAQQTQFEFERICGVLEDIDDSNSAILDNTVSVLKDILDAICNIRLTDDDIYNAAMRAHRRNMAMTGGY